MIAMSIVIVTVKGRLAMEMKPLACKEPTEEECEFGCSIRDAIVEYLRQRAATKEKGGTLIEFGKSEGDAL